MTPAPASPRVAAELLQRCTAIVCCGPDGCKHSESCLATEFDQRDATAIITLAQAAARREDAEWCEIERNKVVESSDMSDSLFIGKVEGYEEAASHLRAMMVKP